MTLAIKTTLILTACATAIYFTSCTPPAKNNTLKDAFKNKFNIGVALNTWQIDGKDSNSLQIVLEHFNSIVAENCMKSENLQPQQGIFNFTDADKFVTFGEQNNLNIIGHTLIWHSQAPKWFFTDAQGNQVTRDTLIERMRTHINTVVSRYQGRVHGWDVVNEAITDDGKFRESKFYQIIGPDYIDLAFEFAMEADPEAELYYNDYNNEKPAKRQATVELIKHLKNKGLKVDGIGMQGHCTMDFPLYEDFEASIIAFGQLTNVMITELDLTVIPWPTKFVTADVSLRIENDNTLNPYANGIPDSVQTIIDQRWADLFSIMNKHHDKITRVTLWGLHDNQTWRNHWPIPGRKDYPLLFGRDYQPKPVVNRIIEIGNNNN